MKTLCRTPDRTWLTRFLSYLPHSAALVVLATAASAAGSGKLATIDIDKVLVSHFDGWGTSLCWWANVVGGYANREEYADLAFTQLGLNIVRYNIGGGENPARDNTMEYRARMPGLAPQPGKWDWSADANQRWMLRAAVARGADHVVAFVNSPPYWMTYSGSVTGSLNGTDDNLRPEFEAPFAEYNGHVRQRLDLYTRKSVRPLPLIIVIHGGAWTGGDKGQMHPAPFLTEGFAVASLDYRLSQDAAFPAQIEDCKAAVRWLRRNAAQLNIDPDRIGVWGESAGGHLAALLGTTGETRSFDVGENLETSSAVQAVADWFGPTDFLQMDAHRLPQGMVHDVPGSPESRLVGGPIQQSREAVGRANPITYIGARTPPFLIAHGDADPLVPHHQSELLEAALKKAGVPVRLYTVKRGAHGFRNTTADELRRKFFNKHLK